jgi:hypothetical protein
MLDGDVGISKTRILEFLMNLHDIDGLDDFLGKFSLQP